MGDEKFISDYLHRIEYHGSVEATEGVLKALQENHLASVPFENLDIMRNVAIQLDIDHLWDKIVHRKRGGICYELNGLFAELLRRIGFNVTYLSAKVPGCDNEFDHVLLMVELRDKWLVDVGFGDGFFTPLRFVEDIPQEDSKGTFRIIHKNNGYELWRNVNSSDSLEYTFTLTPRLLNDFYERCRFFEMHVESRFNKNRLCSLEKRHERISLTDRRLLRTKADVQTRIEIRSENEFTTYLEELFGIVL